MSAATNASPETRAFLAAALALPLPTQDEREQITRNLATRLIRQRDGRKAAALARSRRRKGNPMGGIGFGRKAGRPPKSSLTPVQQAEVRAMFLAGDYGTMKAIAERVGSTAEIVARLLEHEGLRKPPAKDAIPMGEVPEGCIASVALRELLGVGKTVLMGRLKRAGVKPAGRASKLFWYSLDELRAKGLVP